MKHTLLSLLPASLASRGALVLGTALLSLHFIAAPGLRAENAVEIASRFDSQKIEALKNYLEANPEAADLDAALSILVGTYLNLGDFEKVPDLLLRRYELQPKGPEASLQTIAMEIARPLVETSIVSNQRDKAKAFIAQLKSDFEGSPESRQLNQFLDQIGADLYLPGVGDEMEFAFTDLEGKEVDLADLRDQVVLVDFWATWCGPCIAELPHLLTAYEKYHEKGFEIIGISLDEDRDALEAFVEENEMAWPQYFDGKGWENEIAQRFGIRGIPATFLVGKDGTIIAANLRGDELESALESALSEGQ